ncbi:hypothetical protein AZE42_09573 [Rhizopogon vesiculosus]|uniref:Fork-head domain-containing protein n=1 Tax=Rhizopogon vesiculosus TaxID=180088 RepID=A0A1J8QIX8_9AGAM|nr:hypothetical protein AZE42_09573 [Rhizopogon vesiculosus]
MPHWRIGLNDAGPYLRETLRITPYQDINLWALPEPPEGEKLNQPYPILIKLAIYGSPHKQLTLQEIYTALEDRFEWFKDRRDEKAWKSARAACDQGGDNSEGDAEASSMPAGPSHFANRLSPAASDDSYIDPELRQVMLSVKVEPALDRAGLAPPVHIPSLDLLSSLLVIKPKCYLTILHRYREPDRWSDSNHGSGPNRGSTKSEQRWIWCMSESIVVVRRKLEYLRAP